MMGRGKMFFVYDGVFVVFVIVVVGVGIIYWRVGVVDEIYWGKGFGVEFMVDGVFFFCVGKVEGDRWFKVGRFVVCVGVVVVFVDCFVVFFYFGIVVRFFVVVVVKVIVWS